MRLRVGRVQYINCEPVYYALEHRLVEVDCEITDGTPAELNERLRAGELDVSVISAMEAALRPQAYRLLPDLAIACEGAVESVLLVSDVPIEALDDAPVALNPHSLTSVSLVKLLLAKAYQVRPWFLADASGGSVARLLIGDEALRLRTRFPHRVDLGAAWHTLTGLPFVFAVWAARAEVWAVAEKEVRALQRAFLTAKAFTKAHPEAMVALACKRTGLPADACRQYLTRSLCFDLGPRHLEGLQTFLRYVADAGELPEAPVLQFIPA